MGIKIGKMTTGSLFGKAETVLYPFETKPVPAGLKGHIEVNLDDCIMCGICQRTCPADAIVVAKAARTWAIDRFRCVQCASCVRACPKKCLIMQPTYQKPAREKSVETFTKAEAKAEEKAEA